MGQQLQIGPQAPPKLDTVKELVRDRHGRMVYVELPANHKTLPPEQVIPIIEAQLARMSQPIGARQEAAGDLGGMSGGLFGAAAGGMMGGPPGAILGGILGGGAGGAAASYATGASGEQAGKIGMFQGLMGVPGEIFAATKPLLRWGGQTLDRNALVPLRSPVLDDVRIPGKNVSTPVERATHLAEEAERFGTGLYGRQNTALDNQAAITDLNQQMSQMVRGTGRTLDPTPIFDRAAQHATAQGHAAGNYPEMQAAIEQVRRGLMADPNFGHDVVIPWTPQNVTLPQGWSRQDVLNASPQVQQAIMQMAGAPASQRQFRPDVPATAFQGTKQQTTHDLKSRLKLGGDVNEPNLATIQKAFAHEIGDSLGQVVPNYQPLNRDLSSRIPLQRALEEAVTKTRDTGLDQREVLGIGSLILGSTLNPYWALGGLTAATHRPLAGSTIGRSMKGLGTMMPYLGRGVVSPGMRLGHFLMNQDKEQ